MKRRPEKCHNHPNHQIIELPGKPLVLFITIGLADRRLGNLATPEVHQLLRDIWMEATGWRVNRYMVMPDHLHFFVTPGNLEISLRSWIKYWKSQYTKAHLPQAPRLEDDFWDTTIRSHTHFSEKWEYMRNNPVRKNLVENSDDWPYQGVIHEFTWVSL